MSLDKGTELPAENSLHRQLRELLRDMLAIASPTFHEQDFVRYLCERSAQTLPEWQQRVHEDCFLLSSPWQEGLPHVSLVGHSDVVPEHFDPYIQDERLYGSGASDMKGALAAFVLLLENHPELIQKINLSLLVYSREEMTPLHVNGLYHLLKDWPEYFQSVDLALIGEPTDNTLQLGCVGSIHAKVTVRGLACHSARPWNGENALYKALPFIQQMAALEPVKHRVFGVDFYDVCQITETETQPGRTSLPGWWSANVNFRFAPVRSESEAKRLLYERLESFGIASQDIEVLDTVPPGQVIETAFFKQCVEALSLPIQAKQAWTDVAQLTAHGVPALNFGPGQTAQAHKDNEYIELPGLYEYYEKLKNALLCLA